MNEDIKDEYKNDCKCVVLNYALIEATTPAKQSEEVERLKGLIWKAYQAGEGGMIDSAFINDKGDEILYSQTEIDRSKEKFKNEHNL